MFKFDYARTARKAARDFILAFVGLVALAPTDVGGEDFFRGLGVAAALAAYRVVRDMAGRAPAL